MDERRRCRRLTPYDRIEVRINARVEAKVVDISPLGAQLEVSSALGPASSCSLAIATDNGQLIVRARVQRCRATAVPAGNGRGAQLIYIAGVEFIDLSDEDARRLRAVCKMPHELTPDLDQSRPVASGDQLTAESIEQLLLAV